MCCICYVHCLLKRMCLVTLTSYRGQSGAAHRALAPDRLTCTRSSEPRSPETMKNHTLPIHHLELRVRDLAQLFNSMDPTPFLNKDLDREAEAFIETWAMRHGPDSRMHITIHVENLLDANATMGAEDASVRMGEAIHNFFDYKADLVRGDLEQLLRQGRASLLIGLSFVTVCLISADAIGQLGTGTAFTIARESLTIVGWVAMWRPLQIFLYEWWPLARRIRVYKTLKRAQVRVIQGK